MDLEAAYSHIIKELSTGSRALVRLSHAEVEWLKENLEKSLKAQEHEQLKKKFCVVEHSSATHREFEPIILSYLSSPLSDELTIFALNCARKHIIVDRFKKGQRLHFNFLEILKKLLYSPSPEVVEWTLRTIEECGSQGIYFLKDLDKIKPPPWKWFNAHQRSVREIIAMLENRWRKFEKFKP